MAEKQHNCMARRQDVRRYLPHILLLLFIVQPVMDVTSYWLDALGGSNSVSLLMRFGVLFVTAVLGFALSKRKRAYLLLGAVLLLFAVGHIWACMKNGYANPLYDLTNYIRVVQIPLFTFCFITFLRETGDAGYRTIEYGFLINFSIIAAVEVISTVTGTDPHTYASKSIGMLGWFSTTNSQSAILSSLVPVLLMQVIRKKNVWLLIGATAVSFGVLYLFATRLTYLAIFVCAGGLVIVMLLCRRIDKQALAVLVIGAVVCGAGFGLSPMYQNQSAHQEIIRQKQQGVDDMIAAAEQKYDTTMEESPELCLENVYEYYLGGLTERFGMQRVMQQYEYSSDVVALSGARAMKINFCRFLMEDAGTAARLFGLELQDMVQNGETYDVENDFHGIYFLYGIVGLLLFSLFLLYFVYVIVQALIQKFSTYFTWEAGAFGISLCLMLTHVYCTAGVLRRPNASFYLSVILAVIYYFVKIKTYDARKPDVPST